MSMPPCGVSPVTSRPAESGIPSSLRGESPIAPPDTSEPFWSADFVRMGGSERMPGMPAMLMS
jgi:hypothetical protein